jgi:hypothetical protein
VRSLTPFLDEQVDGRALGIARIVLGVAVLAKGLMTAMTLHEFQSADVLRFPYGPLELTTPQGIIATGASFFWIIFALLFIVGFGTRVTGALLTVSILLVIGVDQQMYSNHLYLTATLVALMTLAGAGARYSVDARLGSGDGLVPRWAVTLIKLQLTSVYLFAGITKLNEGFLSGRVLERSLEAAPRERIEQIVSLEILAPLAILTELFLAFAFWSSRLRYGALVIGVGFHITNVVVMDHSGAFNFTMFALVMLSMMMVFFTRPLRNQDDHL